MDQVYLTRNASPKILSSLCTAWPEYGGIGPEEGWGLGSRENGRKKR